MRYLIELADASAALVGIQALAERARRAAAEVARGGVSVRFLRVVFVPEDGSCFLLYEGESERAIRTAVTRAGIGAGRLTGSLAPEELPAGVDEGSPVGPVRVTRSFRSAADPSAIVWREGVDLP
jgi:hypothetical protein